MLCARILIDTEMRILTRAFGPDLKGAVSMAEHLTLAGKTALITGASRGIGAAISTHLARAGATVLLNYARSEEAARTVAQQIQAGGGKAHLIQADVSKASEVDALFGQVDRTYGGRIDILVNNAGIYLTGSLADTTVEDFDRSMVVNVTSMFLVTKKELTRRCD